MKRIAIKVPDFLSKAGLKKLNQILATSQTLQVYQLAPALGIKPSEAMALFDLLESQMENRKQLMVYHHCEEETSPIVVELRPFGTGYPRIPYKCKNCEEYITEEDDLSYDFFLVLDQAVFVEEKDG